MHDAPAESQTPSRSFGDELRQLLRLGGPIALVQLGTIALNVVDVAMLGHHDPAGLPAMALGNNLVWLAMMFCMGVTTAAEPLLSQAIGANDRDAIPRVLGRGLLLTVLLSVPAGLLLLPAETWLGWFGQPTELVPSAGSYARWQALGVWPFLAYSLFRSLLSAHARVGPQVATIVLGNVLNAALDWLLIFGHAGLPALGATGAALATVLSRWFMLLALVWLGRDVLVPQLRALGSASVRAAACARAPLSALLRLGTPIGLQYVLEMGVFTATALLIGTLDAAAPEAHGAGLAGHQIALQLASTSFMVPLGLGMAAAVRVGWATGRGDLASVRRSVAVALCAGVMVMTCFMLSFLLAPRALAGLLTAHEPALAVAATLVPIAGVFQIGDGLQVVSIGCLRGLGDVRSPVIANTIGYWLLGLPLGCWLGLGLGHGAAGLWWGLVLGLFAVAGALVLVLRMRLREGRGRLAID